MNLYHFTPAGRAPLIAQSGLRAGADNDPEMTCGLPVVWLTRQESNVCTQADIDHMQWVCGHVDRKVGDRMYGGPARLTVRIERHNRRLVNYGQFLRDVGMYQHFAPLLTPAALTQWYVYLGDIAPHKIDTSLPRALALECIDQLLVAMPESRGQLMRTRETIATAPAAVEMFDIQLDNVAVAA
jgi:hypothetical protein